MPGPRSPPGVDLPGPRSLMGVGCLPGVGWVYQMGWVNHGVAIYIHPLPPPDIGPRYGWQAGGRHHTGMFSCFLFGCISI